jgi:subtilisin family serine protease
MYPAMFDLNHSLVVAAHNNQGLRASFSNYSEEYVHIAAPGVDIRSSVPGSFYDSFSGTSMATPHVAGAVALLWGMEPALSARQVKDHLIFTGEVTRGLEGVSRESKRLNILKMLQ